MTTGLLCVWAVLAGSMVQAETEKMQVDYAKSGLEVAEKGAEFRLVK